MALKDLLGNIGQEDFFCKYWDKQPIVIPGASKQLMSCCSIEAIESRLTETDIRFPQFQLAMQGRKLSKQEYTRRKSWSNHYFDDLIDIPAVYNLWNTGATIILQSLQTNYPALIPFLRNLENELNHPVQANAYLTPNNSLGFNAHYDTHDVFVVQIQGNKQWHIWETPAGKIPLKDEYSPYGIKPPGNLFFDGILNPGDVIYLPRGYYHKAITLDEISLHLTIGILSYRRIDALKFLFDSILQDLREDYDKTVWRESLPPSFDKKPDQKFQALRDEVLNMISKRWSTDAAVRRFREDINPINQGLLSSHKQLNELNDNTLLMLNRKTHPVMRRQNDAINLTYGGRMLTLPLSTDQAIRTILKLETFSPSDLTGYGDKSRIGLCKHLLKEGLLKMR